MNLSNLLPYKLEVELITLPKIGIEPLRMLGDDPCYALEEDFIFDILLHRKRYRVKIKKGFEFNGPSIPWYARWYANPSDYRWLIPASAHDEYYGRIQDGACRIICEDGELLFLSRRQVDSLFMALMLKLAFPKPKPYVAFFFVRIFGTSHTQA